MAREIAKRVLVSVFGGALTAFLFALADAAMPDDIQWWMRWVLASVSFVSYAVGGAMGAWQTYRLYEKRATVKQASIDRLKEKNAELVKILGQRGDEHEAAARQRQLREDVSVLPYEDKMLLREVCKCGYVDVVITDVSWLLGHAAIDALVDSNLMANDTRRLRLNRRGREACDVASDLLWEAARSEGGHREPCWWQRDGGS